MPTKRIPKHLQKKRGRKPGQKKKLAPLLSSKRELEQLERMGGLGLSNEKIANLMGVSPATFYRRIEEAPEISERLEKGKAKASITVTNTAYNMAVSGKHAAMTIFWLKVREGWKEPIEATANVNLNINPKDKDSIVKVMKSAEGRDLMKKLIDVARSKGVKAQGK